MDLVELHNEIATLIGSSLSSQRIAANSIILYFGGEPGDNTVRSFWLEPPWRYECDGHVVIGSYDLSLYDSDFASKEEMDSEWTRRCCLIDGVESRVLEAITIDPVSCDITLTFSGGHIMRQFSNSGFHEIGWTYRNRDRQVAIDVSSIKLEIRMED